MSKIDAMGGIEPMHRPRLRAAGIETTDDLLERAANGAGRRALALETGIPAWKILSWVHRGDLMRVSGLDPRLADLLDAVGVETLRRLRAGHPAKLAARLATANHAHKTRLGRSVVDRPPQPAEVRRWIGEARTLPDLVRG